jgi:transcriptional regulator with XRE-family HTH domain
MLPNGLLNIKAMCLLLLNIAPASRSIETYCVHRTYMGGIERGERNPSLNNIAAIAKALDTGPSELFQFVGLTRSMTAP